MDAIHLSLRSIPVEHTENALGIPSRNMFDRRLIDIHPRGKWRGVDLDAQAARQDRRKGDSIQSHLPVSLTWVQGCS
jgi:hypothetical protein